MKYNYKIIIDSCCKLKDEYLNDERFAFITRSIEAVKSVCPSPAAFMDAYKTEAEHIYVVTPELGKSDSYESALVAADNFEKNTGKELNIHIVDSESDNRNWLKIVEEIINLEELGLSFEEIVGRIEVLKNSIIDYFTPETVLA